MASKGIKSALAALEKRFGEKVVLKMNDKNLDVDTFSSGRGDLDVALGSGYGVGKIIEIYAESGCGKTGLALEAIASVQSKGGVCAIVDSEHALNTEYCEQIGVNIDDLYISQPSFGEQAIEAIRALVETGEIDLIVVDSVAAMIPKAELEGESGEVKMGLQARMMSQAMKLITGPASDNGCTIIFINQLRSTIAMYGPSQMGLVANTEKRKTYLSVAAGNIWNKKIGKEDPNYAEEEYKDSKGETQIRKGARYKVLTGRITGVEFRQHPQYGESVAVTINDEGDDFILSISTNNHYSQSMLKALLIMDVEKDIYISPYDIEKPGEKRNRGISFRQDGVKLDFTTIVRPSEFEKERSFFKGGDPKMIKRFFEDLTDWYIGQVREKVVPKLDSIVPSVQAPKPTPKAVENVVVEKEVESPKEVAKPSVIKMKKFIKSYIEENYEGETLPKLSKEEVGVWYELALADEELPFKDENEVSQGDLDSELSALLG